MSEEQVLPINEDWGVILVDNKPSEGVLLGKHVVRTTLDPLHKALFHRLMHINNMLLQSIQEQRINESN